MRLAINLQNPDIGNCLGKCEVRSYARGDEKSLARNANDKKVWINLRDRFPYPYTLTDAEDWIKLATAQAGTEAECNFAIAVEDQVIGGIGIMLQTDVNAQTAEFGYWLGVDYWGKGIMTAVVSAMSDYFFRHFDLVRLYANVFDWNPASSRVLEKSGWAFEGRLRKAVFKDGKYCDQLIYARIKGDK